MNESPPLALTFDDVLVLPGLSEVHPNQVDLRTRLCRDLVLKIPIVSAAMDTVTESRLAIAVAQEGGVRVKADNGHPADVPALVALDLRAIPPDSGGIAVHGNEEGRVGDRRQPVHVPVRDR